MDEMSETLDRFVGALQSEGITYAISGSVASSAFGMARATRDIDMIAQMSSEDAGALADRLGKAFYLDETAARRAVEEGDCFNAIDLKTMYQIDVFVPKPSKSLESQLRRRIIRRIGGPDGPEVYLCSPEDVILSKLRWYRIGNEASEQQMNDVAGILRVQGRSLDRDYLREWAAELGIQDLLAKAFQLTR